MDQTPFARLAHLGEQLEQTSKRQELATLLADFLRGLWPAEVPPAVRLAIGQVFPEWDGRALNVSGGTVSKVVDRLIDASPALRQQVSAQAVDGGEAVRMLLEGARREPPTLPPLTIPEVFAAFEEIAATAGKGSSARKEALLHELLTRATPVEAKHLVKVIYGEMRHGVSEGIMLDGIAQAAGVKARWVRRANQLWGDLGEVASVALAQGEGALKQANLRLFRPLKPMLAQTTEDLAEAFERYGGRVALEYKLDGARVQIHHQGEKVHIYSRSLADVTASLPDVVAQVRSMLVAQEAILEGEAIAIDERGRPLPFQHLMRRFRRKRAVADTIAEVPVQLHLFDALYVDGRTLIDAPNEVRWAALEKAVFGQEGSDAGHRGGEGREGREGRSLLVQRCLPKTVEEATAFAEQACRDGHEGVMAKDLGSAYTPGVRGKSWLKFKHVLSLDLVVVAADWGYGRRHGWLSNYHLAARDAETGEYLVVGKTFKGLTDDEFQEMTERLLELERSRQRSTVTVRPQVVVEVVFNELQASPQYQSGLALRFARIARIRDDKRAAEADTLQTLRQLYEQQFAFKGKRP